MVYKSTTIGDTLLDCIFTKSIHTQEKVQIISAYFSYHSALILEIFEYNIEIEARQKLMIQMTISLMYLILQ